MRGDLGGVEGVEDGVAALAGAGPLGVEACLRVREEVLRRGELFLDREDGE